MLVPRFSDKTDGGAVKDTVNDLLKNSATLGKDLYAEEIKNRA